MRRASWKECSDQEVVVGAQAEVESVVTLVAEVAVEAIIVITTIKTTNRYARKCPNGLSVSSLVF